MVTSIEPAPVAIRYQCPICDEGYDTMEAAVACRDGSDSPAGWCGWQPGDMVLIPGKGYYPNPGETPAKQAPWLAFVEPARPESSSHFDHKDRWHYWWVVTALERHREERHRLIVYVATEVNGEVRCGWNPADGGGHHRLFRPTINLAGQITTDYHSDYYWDRLGTEIMLAKPSEALLRQSKKLIGNVSGWLL